MLRAMVFRNFVHFRDQHVLNFREGKGATYFIGASSTGKTAVLELVRRCMNSKLNSSVTNRFDEKEHGFVFCQFEREVTDRKREGADREREGADREREGADREREGADREREGADREREGADREREGADRERQGADREKITMGFIVEGTNYKQTSAEHNDLNDRGSLNGKQNRNEKEENGDMIGGENIIQSSDGEHYETSKDKMKDSNGDDKNERKETKREVIFHKIMIDQSSKGNLRIKCKTFSSRQGEKTDSKKNVKYYPNDDESCVYNQEELEKLFKQGKDDNSGFADELVQWLLGVIEQKNALSFTDDPWEKVSEQYVGVLSWRGLGPFQWTKSETISEEHKEQNYKDICEQAEIIANLIGSEDIEDEKENRIFNFLTEPNRFVFRKEKGNIFVKKGDKEDDIEFPLLKVSVGIVEAKQFALLMSHKHFQTICLEEPERGMHPQMIERMKTILYLECKDKTVIITTHSPAFIDSISIQSSCLFFRKEKEVCGIRQITSDQFNKHLKMAETEDLKRIFFSTRVLLVEGTSDKIVIQAIFNHKLEDLKTDENKRALINSYQIIVVEGCSKVKNIQEFCKEIHVPCAAVLDRDTCIEIDGRGCVDASDKDYNEYTDGQSINIFLGEPFKRLSNALRTKENRFIWKDGDIEDFLLGERNTGKGDTVLKILKLQDKKGNSRKTKKKSIKDKLNKGISQEQSSDLGKHLNEYEEVVRLCDFLGEL